MMKKNHAYYLIGALLLVLFAVCTLAAQALGLTKTYFLKGETVRALRGVKFEVPAGDYVAIMGPSGSGKSTLAQVLAGHPAYEITEGSVTYKGMDLLDMEPDATSASEIRKRIAARTWPIADLDPKVEQYVRDHGLYGS